MYQANFFFSQTHIQNFLYKLNSSVLIIPINFDNGYSSDLLNVSPIYSMGFIMSKNIKNINFLFGIDNALRIGGNIK